MKKPLAVATDGFRGSLFGALRHAVASALGEVLLVVQLGQERDKERNGQTADTPTHHHTVRHPAKEGRVLLFFVNVLDTYLEKKKEARFYRITLNLPTSLHLTLPASLVLRHHMRSTTYTKTENVEDVHGRAAFSHFRFKAFLVLLAGLLGFSSTYLCRPIDLSVLALCGNRLFVVAPEPVRHLHRLRYMFVGPKKN